MKISVLGYSGSGKSTLARKLAEHYGTDVLHLDTVLYLPDWKRRELDEQKSIVEDFLDTHEEWVIDGTYSKLSFERKLEEADQIIMLLFPRLTCLARVIRRYRRYRGSSRPDMAEGCNEKLDLKFILWILFLGRNKAIRDRYREVQIKYPEKTVVVKNQKQLDTFMDSLHIGNL